MLKKKERDEQILKIYTSLVDKINAKGGEILTSNFTTTKDKIKIKCNQNHIWETQIKIILYMNGWCPSCSAKIAGKKAGLQNTKRALERIKEERRKCFDCDLVQDVCKFPLVKSKNAILGHYFNKRCASCLTKYINISTYKNYTDSVQNFLNKRMSFAQKKCKAANKEFSIDIEYIMQIWNYQNGKCALSGLEMTITRDREFSCSIDRIDSSISYIKGNIQLVCSRINRMKCNLKDDVFILICNNVSNHRGKNV